MREMALVPLNIFSGSFDSLGAALSNSTELARAKGKLTQRFSVTFDGRQWVDASAAFEELASGATEPDDLLMAEIICAKLIQHPALMHQVLCRGGVRFLSQCSHWTGAATPPVRRWEGEGLDSRFIRALVRGYQLAEALLLQEAAVVTAVASTG